MNAQQQCHRLVNTIVSAGAGAVIAGPLWRPDLAQRADDWLFMRGVVMPWRRSCPVPQQRSDS